MTRPALTRQGVRDLNGIGRRAGSERDPDTCYVPVDGGLRCGSPIGECEHTQPARVHDTNFLIGGSVCGEMSGRDTLTTEWERVTCDGCKSVPF